MGELEGGGGRVAGGWSYLSSPGQVWGSEGRVGDHLYGVQGAELPQGLVGEARVGLNLAADRCEERLTDGRSA